jgi:hypothetical protein
VNPNRSTAVFFSAPNPSVHNNRNTQKYRITIINFGTRARCHDPFLNATYNRAAMSVRRWQFVAIATESSFSFAQVFILIPEECVTLLSKKLWKSSRNESVVRSAMIPFLKGRLMLSSPA